MVCCQQKYLHFSLLFIVSVVETAPTATAILTSDSFSAICRKYILLVIIVNLITHKMFCWQFTSTVALSLAVQNTPRQHDSAETFAASTMQSGSQPFDENSYITAQSRYILNL